MATLTPRVSVLASLWMIAAPLAAPLAAQSYRDFTLVRNREQPYRSLVQIRVGYRGVDSEGERLERGLAADSTLGGFFLYHTKDVSRGEDWDLDLYAGLDGAFISLKDHLFSGKKSQSRLELFGRPKAFYREGYYDGDRYLVTGQYEGRDYGARIGTAQALDRGLILDISLFYRRNDFSRNGQTNANTPDFLLPDDFSEYGGALTIEQNTVVLDRTLGLPRSGMLISVMAENAQNNSSRTFGSTSTYTSTLPSGFWRGEAHIEGYWPNAKSGVWELSVDGGFYDKADRVRSFHAEHVQGHIWGDGALGYRMAFGQSFILKPFVQAQYAKVLERLGVGSTDEIFWGGGVSSSWIFNENMALVFDYSYVNNPSRGHAGLDEDLYGEHQFFAGMDISFGSGYRGR